MKRTDRRETLYMIDGGRKTEKERERHGNKERHRDTGSQKDRKKETHRKIDIKRENERVSETEQYMQRKIDIKRKKNGQRKINRKSNIIFLVIGTKHNDWATFLKRVLVRWHSGGSV